MKMNLKDYHNYLPNSKSVRFKPKKSQPAWPSGWCIRLSSGQYEIPRSNLTAA